MIRLEKVGKDYQGTTAVREVSFELKAGQTMCLIGTSGCGKTTTLKMINRLIEPSRGRILVDEQDVTAMDLIALRRKLGYVVQKGGLFPHMTIAENVGLLPRLEGWDGSRIAQRVAELMGLMNLQPGVGTRYPSELSGGQQQRVGVARALSLDPPILLMDEPFGALDPITRRQIQDEFIRLKQSLAKTIILVTHDLQEAFHLADVIALMDQGEIVQMGSSDDFLKRPANDFVANFVQSQVLAAQGDHH
ncbi:MAG: ABC transporter ATP-binding protein [Candidatus Xenobia bacterium]